ncbi:MAG: MFS transporter [Rhizobiales bacterium]|nr:MFS transporter [Hyphomicrobiales bacterium]
MLMSVAMYFSFAVWSNLLNNFAIERAQFTGEEIGWLQSIREIPGFLSFTAVFVIIWLREQTFALVSLALLGLGTALTGYFPAEIGFYCTTFLMSVGFHYYETMNQSLALQWLPKATAPRQLGQIMQAGAFATISAYGIVWLCNKYLALDYVPIYVIGGGLTVVIAAGLWLTFPRFKETVPQRKELILRKRYWLYYALTFMAGARRQIFIVFAAFMMVEKFGFSIAQVSMLYIANAVFNMFFAPMIGGLIAKWGERRALIFEYIGLIGVFVAYAFVENPWIAAGLYLLDHAFFALAIAIKTYFQKIADPGDIAPTAGVAFSINHVAAVGLPVLLGYIWIQSHSAVFLIGAGMALVSLVLSFLVPHNPDQGNEVSLSGRGPSLQPAE